MSETQRDIYLFKNNTDNAADHQQPGRAAVQ